MVLRNGHNRSLPCVHQILWVIPAVESKVFGIGVESYTVGSNEFYQNYAATRGICCLLDTGHYHPTEVVSDKIPALLAFYDKLALHVSRPVRWDSDHAQGPDIKVKTSLNYIPTAKLPVIFSR